MSESTDADSGRIWLISSDTLAKLPELYEQAAVHQVETHLPHVLVRHEFLGLPLWQWLAILLAIPVAALLGWLAVQLLRLPWYLLGALPAARGSRGLEFFCASALAGAGRADPRNSGGLHSHSRPATAPLPAGGGSGRGHRHSAGCCGDFCER